MKEYIESIIGEYTNRANQILENQGGDFNYDKDWDDQMDTAEAETEYNMCLEFVEKLKLIKLF